MKRIKATNGYTIYQMTERDINNRFYNATAGNYVIFLSSDIRDYGVNGCDPEFDDIETLNECLEIAGDVSAVAYEMTDDGATVETIDNVETVLRDARDNDNVFLAVDVYDFITDETTTEILKYENVIDALSDIENDEKMIVYAYNVDADGVALSDKIPVFKI